MHSLGPLLVKGKSYVIYIRHISNNCSIVRERETLMYLRRLIFPVFVLLLFPLRHIRVSLSDNETVVPNVSYVYYINKRFTPGPTSKFLDDQQK